MLADDDSIVFETTIGYTDKSIVKNASKTFNGIKYNHINGGREEREEQRDGQPSSRGSDSISSKSNRTCSKCWNDERTRKLRIESIKMNILNKLNMDRAPNVSLRMLPKIPPVDLMLNHLSQTMNDDSGLIDHLPRTISKIVGNDYFGPLNQRSTHLFKSNNFDHHHRSKDYDPDENDDDEGEFFFNAEKSIVFAQEIPSDRLVDDGHGSIQQYFKFPANIQHQSRVEKAFLWFYLKGSSSVKSNCRIIIYQVHRGTPSMTMFKTKRISNSTARKGGWINVRIEKLVTKWFENPESNLGLAIHAYDSSGQRMTIIHSTDVSNESPLRPFIEIRVDKLATNSRRKRTIGLNCDDKSSEVRCCRYPLTVDFEEFGWDWIIAPKRYQANYCSGECPFVLMNQYPHTHLIQQINDAVGPCCSPRKMSSISMLYMDGDYNVIYGIVPNMVVDRCGCS
ncbi:hypothetical protein NH340_JMT09237 [Sarcoptes scabiei]|nr:hypothetical protein NH340_JMT09237 [Sarcoptes scabiei]